MMSHPMHTYLLGLKKNQSTRSSANARQTKPTQETDCQSLDLRQTPHKQANMETECQSLDLHQTPNQQTHTGNQLPIAGLTSDSNKQTRHGKRIANRWAYVGLQPEKEKQLTQTKQKGARRDQLISCLRTSSGMRIRAT